MRIILLILLSLLIILSSSFVIPSSSIDDFKQTGTCGDGIWDSFSEECDGSDGCNNQCYCNNGFTSNGKGNCIMQCMYGSACIGGCIAPDVCVSCSESSGFNEDCSNCKENYVYNTIGQCGNLTERIWGCKEWFEMQGTPSAYRNVTMTSEHQTITLDAPGMYFPMQINRCTPYVSQDKPYVFGAWVALRSTVGGWIVAETDKHYTSEEIEFAEQQKKVIGNDFAISEQKNCASGNSVSHHNYCLDANNDISAYIHSPRMVVYVNSDEVRYLHIHLPYGQRISNWFKMLFTSIAHPCSTYYKQLNWNELQLQYTFELNYEYSVNSNSVCVSKILRGQWFKLKGSDDVLMIDTCNSSLNYSVSIQLIEVNQNESLTDFSCSSNKATCSRYVASNCENSKLARMVAQLEPTKNYFIFVSIDENNIGIINITFKTVCPFGCGEHGFCNNNGVCICEDGYVDNGGCSLCGNGKIDDSEECDLSAQEDSHCATTCKCYFGFIPITINGTTKCSPPTCNNGVIDQNEECDGGKGCDHCFCQEGYIKYEKAREYCLSTKCGNGKLEEEEECDSGDGCYECECQENWYSYNSKNCKDESYGLVIADFIGRILIPYWIFLILIGCISGIVHWKVTSNIKKELKEMEGALPFFETTIIPFNKENSQFIDVKSANPYFTIDPPSIDFQEERVEVGEVYSYTFTITNNWKEVLHYTFHAGEYLKYDITFKPVTGSLRQYQSVDIQAMVCLKCTTVINERVPVTIRFGQLNSILKNIKKENPEMLDQLSQNSSHVSENSQQPGEPRRSFSSLSNISNKSGGSDKNSSHEQSQQSSKSSKKHRTDRIRKFHLYLPLQAESTLSTKLDYEEIHLHHPPIGSGTFGIVYRAEWRGVDVAVKVMKTDLFDLNDLLPNFLQEVELLEKIRCPYIINFIGSVTSSDTLALVTEFCPLGSLRRYIKTNSMSVELKLRFCHDIASGMDYLHQNDITHRDLKTDNVLVYSKNPFDPVVCKVTDFGTSRSFIESLGKTGIQNIGTPMYMAPELNTGEQDMTLKSDVFSFAICCTEIWLGRDPYDPEKFPDSESILKFVGSGKRIELPQDCLIKTIIEQSWKHNPKDRPHFDEVLHLIDGIIKQMHLNVSPSQNQSSVQNSFDKRNSVVFINTEQSKSNSSHDSSNDQEIIL
ncbi:protein kinase domain containing protein [Entamoeba histolytica HM-1:IMSS-B]|uniref:Protein kinase domain containing protein n=6 Tax=Entamoeba histolytica TaxID=5759 RepID=C4M5X8_ENTH1|nr:protein kinase domain containing protein [Entamoeba histolytica HM-1:IMSS]EMD44450.1 serine/threonine protein kinase, putative [Entamoeba histolytica KU27]EMH72575.1 protein kinase domain containing protein [Entamoeba histolytica HM-1:IMSS-B]EMS13678.1 serine-threonine protein kinase, putative [Entamoeba histolytica HM-3:IMSS]ENY61596.1 serine-threonine protein kinase, putative [Entamoeba histolytica HM-1:IMSS-A]GAT96849.1 protein kinase domain containing protein [Entamoeba histolytica]|eukprot:XP_652593.1 protein kinase domain containing protein [Entamoeba histolytica HM-1:IMSS]